MLLFTLGDRNLSALKNGCHFLPGFFQTAYVTTDLDQAMQAFDQHYGVKRFHSIRDISFDDHTTISIATAYVGDTMLELIEPKGRGNSMYEVMLPGGSDFAIRHHHHGHLYTDEDEWNRVLALVEDKRQPVAYLGGHEGVLKALYIDTRDVLGHYLEYIYCTPAGLEFLNQAPRN